MQTKIKVVFDTNIYISAVIFGGNPRQCLELARTGEVRLYTSKAILLELSKKLLKKFDWNKREVAELIEGIAKFAKIVSPKQKLATIKSDPSDNIFLECAQEARVDYVVSGDKKHILPLKKFKSIEIIPAKTFLDIFYHKI